MSNSPTRDYLNELDEAQRAAVVYNDGPALVLAGAGSGKTRVLVYKLLHLIHSGYNPSKLMALTFTNKAAREMKSRMEPLIGRSARMVKMGTFHSIFLRILREHAELLGYTRDFTLYNATDSKNKVKNIIKLLGLDEKVYKPSLIHSRISNAKNYLKTPKAYQADRNQSTLDQRANIPQTGDIYARYNHELMQANAMDFDDLLLLTNILFRDYPDVLELWQERIDYLLIDEYQDTNFAQHMLAHQLMSGKGRIFAVGDDAQSIYSFRGANIQNMLQFHKSFPSAKTFKLERNYRSTQTIVNTANALIAHNEEQLHKEVFSRGDKGEGIEIYQATSGEDEASWVARSIQELKYKHRDNYDAFALLYRTNQQSRILEQKLRLMGIPFRLWGGHSFFDHKEIMDAVAYLRLMINPRDDEAMLRVINYPKRGIGDTTIKKLREEALHRGLSITELIYSAESYNLSLSKATVGKLSAFALLLERMRARTQEQDSLYNIVEFIINSSGIPAELKLDTGPESKGRQDNLQELLASIDEYERNIELEGDSPSLAGYLSEIALLTDQDNESDEDSPRVSLMTIHASKGLEFPHVFILGLEEQLFPSPRCQTQHEIEEERRLLYVAITRAEKSCHISYANERFRHGRSELTRPSRFLRELPHDLVIARGGHRYYLREESFSYPRSSVTENKGRNPSSGTLPTHFDSPAPLPSEAPQLARQIRLGSRPKEHIEPKHEQAEGLSIGARVKHPKFGAGIILNLEGYEGNVKATVRFDSGEEKKLLLRFAQLELI